jgi:hypothetical protein
MKGPPLDWGFAASKTCKMTPNRIEIMSMVKSEQINDLVEKDELTWLRNSKEGVLSQFSEAAIRFLPSYKFENPKRKTSTLGGDLDLASTSSSGPERPYSLKRIPAYCDRILYFADHRHSLTSLHYDRISIYTLSDHDPVVGMYHLEQVSGIGDKPLVATNPAVLTSRLTRIWSVNYFRFAVMFLIFILYFIAL